ncbi:hypothetical protein TNCV_40141 [Trichonephila clavipes]|nr:hypothetical protein TNCV_40141 [Trichonephila clavipes]
MMNAEEKSNICERLPCFNAPHSSESTIRFLEVIETQIDYSINPSHIAIPSREFSRVVCSNSDDIEDSTGSKEDSKGAEGFLFMTTYLLRKNIVGKVVSYMHHPQMLAG